MKRTQIKISKRQNAIFMGLGIAALVAIFFYQVDYVKPNATATGNNGVQEGLEGRE